MDIPYDPDFIYDPSSDGEEDMFDEQDDDMDFDIELDDNYDPVAASEIGVFEMAVAAGFGHHMAEEELDEDKIARWLLEKMHPKKEQEKVPLSDRYEGKDERGKPFEKWYLNVLRGKTKITDPIKHTEKELFLIAQAEIEDEIND